MCVSQTTPKSCSNVRGICCTRAKMLGNSTRKSNSRHQSWPKIGGIKTGGQGVAARCVVRRDLVLDKPFVQRSVDIRCFSHFFCNSLILSQRQLVHGSHRSGWGSSHTSRGTHASGEVLSVFDVLDYETVMECVPPAWNIAPDAPGTVAPDVFHCSTELCVCIHDNGVASLLSPWLHRSR